MSRPNWQRVLTPTLGELIERARGDHSMIDDEGFEVRGYRVDSYDTQELRKTLRAAIEVNLDLTQENYKLRNEVERLKADNKHLNGRIESLTKGASPKTSSNRWGTVNRVWVVGTSSRDDILRNIEAAAIEQALSDECYLGDVYREFEEPNWMDTVKSCPY